MHAIFGVLLAAGMFSLFFALANWRHFAEHEQYLQHLRSVIAGPQVFTTLLASASPVDGPAMLHTLCEEVLGARVAYVFANHALAALVAPLSYPAESLPPLIDGEPPWATSQALHLPIDPSRYGGARWAVPLWSARGPIGVLLLGDRRDGGLYTQEEMEIARAAGEHLLDTAAASVWRTACYRCSGRAWRRAWWWTAAPAACCTTKFCRNCTPPCWR